MGTKDIITLALSGTALVVSFISAWYSARRQETESERQFRGRMTDLAVALIDSTLKIEKLDAVPYQSRPPALEGERGIELQRTAALSRQADRLITKDTEKLLTDVDFLTLAQAFAKVGDTSRADIYWARTLAASTDAFYSSTNRLNYAWYLFSLGRPEQARTQYWEAAGELESSPGQHDRRSIEVGWFLEGCMRLEAQFGFRDQATAVRDKAREAYEQIANEADRASRIATLEESFTRLLSGAWSPPPAPGSVNPIATETPPSAEDPSPHE